MIPEKQKALEEHIEAIATILYEETQAEELGSLAKNETLIKWVNHQPLDNLLNCVGDGHLGIWNLMKRFNPQGDTREIKELVSSGRESL